MANSVTARFNDDCKVFVSMSDDTTVDKAVIIDAEGNETDIGGGGGASDFSTAEVTVTTGIGEEFLMLIPIVSTETDECTAVYQFSGSGENELIVPLYKGKALAVVDGQYTVNVTGDAEFDEEEYMVAITGNCTITLS